MTIAKFQINYCFENLTHEPMVLHVSLLLKNSLKNLQVIISLLIRLVPSRF